MTARPLQAHGWTILAHPLFLDQIEELVREVETLRSKDPDGYRRRNATKRLAAIAKLALDVVPRDPTLSEYRLGDTLGCTYRHWFRAKFFQQYRLFFRYHARSRIIVFAWVNDEDTKRAYESADDAYRTFRKMLERDDPPDGWERLIASSRVDGERLRGLFGGAASTP